MTVKRRRSEKHGAISVLPVTVADRKAPVARAGERPSGPRSPPCARRWPCTVHRRPSSTTRSSRPWFAAVKSELQRRTIPKDSRATRSLSDALLEHALPRHRYNLAAAAARYVDGRVCHRQADRAGRERRRAAARALLRALLIRFVRHWMRHYSSLRTVGMAGASTRPRCPRGCGSTRCATRLLEPSLLPLHRMRRTFCRQSTTCCAGSYVVHLGAGRWKVSDEQGGRRRAADQAAAATSRADEATSRRNACGRRARRTPEYAQRPAGAGTPAAPRRRRRRRPSARRRSGLGARAGAEGRRPGSTGSFLDFDRF